MDPFKRHPMREWSFRVEGVTVPGEVMCIVGSCKELGEWDPKRVVPMNPADGEYTTESFTNSSAMRNMSGVSHLHVPSYDMDGISSTSEINITTS